MPATSKPRTAPVVTYHLHEADGETVLEIRRTGKRRVRVDHYLVQGFPASLGAAFALTKLVLPALTYYVCLEADGTGWCSCRGFEARDRCKHIGGARLVRQEASS